MSMGLMRGATSKQEKDQNFPEGVLGFMRHGHTKQEDHIFLVQSSLIAAW